MQNLQKGFAYLPVLLIIALLALGGAAYYFAPRAVAPRPPDATGAVATTTAPQRERADWKNIELSPDPGASYNIKYPSDWSVSDYPISCQVSFAAAASLVSPVRNDLPGYVGTPVAYLLQFCIAQGKTVVRQGFIRVPIEIPPRKSLSESQMIDPTDIIIPLADGPLQQTNEYKTAQDIIAANNFNAQSIPADVASWNTYRDETYEFELKYPESWQKYDTTEGIGFGEIDGSGFEVSVISTDQTVAQYVNNMEERYQNQKESQIKNIGFLVGAWTPHYLDNTSSTVLNGAPAIQGTMTYVVNGAEKIITFVQGKGVIYELSRNWAAFNGTLGNKSTYDLIVSTFKLSK